MGSIKTQDAKGLFTKALVDVYKEKNMPMNFLRSFFRTVEEDTKEVSIEVQRGTEKVAVDVLRGTEGNMNQFTQSSEKIIVPPYYREGFPMTDLDFYDRLFGERDQSVEVRTFSRWLEKATEKITECRYKIERAYEKQIADVFSSGVVSLQNSTNIDFKRKAGSMVDLGGSDYWDQASTDPIADLQAGAKFLRTVGKMQGGVVNVIMGDSALAAFLNNTAVQNRADIRNFSLDNITGPQRNALGGVLHGRVTIGSWEANIWSYPEYYDVSSTSTPYISDNEVIMLPTQPRFTLAFGSVPMIMRDERNAEFPEFITNQRAAYAVGNYLDTRGEKHIIDVKSAGIAIPVAVDQIYTIQALA